MYFAFKGSRHDDQMYEKPIQSNDIAKATYK